MNLQTPIRYVKGVGPHRARTLEKLGIHTIEDMLLHVPFRYDDFSQLSPISQIQEGETVTVHGTVLAMRNIHTRSRKSRQSRGPMTRDSSRKYSAKPVQIQKARIQDASGTIEATWFNQPYLAETIKEGQFVSLSGKAKMFGTSLNLQSPQYEILDRNHVIQNTKYKIQDTSIHTGRLVPVYPGTADLHLKWFRSKVKMLLDTLGDQLADYLPQGILDKEHFLSFSDALHTVHFPDNEKKLEEARRRLAFDELFLLQATAQIRRHSWHKQSSRSFTIEKKKLAGFIAKLPFTLTTAQKRVTQEILSDMSKRSPMNRLLQGDVGSGKTVVAAIAAYVAHINGATTIIMAPTEILAKQQAKALVQLLKPFTINVSLITGSTKKTKREIAHVTVGTHALLHEAEGFKNCGLVVIDEQHRFGVKQRALLRHKSKKEQITPHILTMTATPIPRTIALTFYGDLDLSVIDEMPRGRKVIKTWVVPPAKRKAAYEWIHKQNTPTFIVCPFIEPSESMETIKSATAEYDRLSKRIFPDRRLGLIHGKLSSHEKSTVLTNFRKGMLDILVATPVVEVGIDIPTATIMMIEAADRFGLAQLHQLRGRVGRGGQQAYCLLFSSSRSPNSSKRLKSLERVHSGLELAHIDLKLRGSGDVYGTAQHGFRNLQFAPFATLTLITKAKKYAHSILQESPSLKSFPLLRSKLHFGTIAHISPD